VGWLAGSVMSSLPLLARCGGVAATYCGLAWLGLGVGVEARKVQVHASTSRHAKAMLVCCQLVHTYIHTYVCNFI